MVEDNSSVLVFHGLGSLEEHCPGVLKNVLQSGFVCCVLMIRLGYGWRAFLSASFPGYHVVSVGVLAFSWVRQHCQATPVLFFFLFFFFKKKSFIYF